MTRPFPCLAAALVACLVALQDPKSGPTEATDLLGQPFATALARLGPPERGNGLAGCVTWTWRDAGGGWLRLCVHQEVVVQVDASHAKGAVAPQTTPSQGAYPGQPVAELLGRLGNPLRAGTAFAPTEPGRVAAPGSQAPAVPIADALLVYPDARLLVSAGRVLGPAPELPPSRGPR